MNPIHDTDVLLLLAVALASKRKPATLDELITALSLTDKRLPPKVKLHDAFTRLSANGLMIEQDGGYTLTEAAQTVLALGRKNYEHEERVFRVKERLAEFEAPAGKHPVIQLAADALGAAISAYEASLPPLTKTEKAELKREQAGAPRRPPAASRGPGGRPRSRG
ncbi:hypothetical protein OPU71_09170 [Niveibacterium sp. 24ML]|uniref:hypothetical protein n=1 Tax=Niveibacterium sp. 24ML TaxID=2985512 RepID=UPI00226F4866|nr:hypothetical protein [Niveibacterium sp. 24ML]MCX9156289.1 hypothetical protein [Niveibacterium sp. 24ML]